LYLLPAVRWHLTGKRVTVQKPTIESNEEWDFEAHEIKALAASVDEIAAQAEDPWHILMGIGRELRGDAPQSHLIASAEECFAYTFVPGSHYGSTVIGTEFSSAEGDWPDADEAPTASNIAAWGALADLVENELARTHIQDVLHSLTKERRRPATEALALAYLNVARMTQVEAFYRGSCLRRAWSLARACGSSVEQQARIALYDATVSILQVDDVPAGVLFQVLEPLGAQPRDGVFRNPDRGMVEGLLQTIESRHNGLASFIDGILAIREQLASSAEEKAEARRAAVVSYMGIASRESGLRSMSWLSQAGRLADQYGFIDLRDDVVSRLQELGQSDLGFEVMSHHVAVPRYVMDERLGIFRRSRDLRSAMSIWFVTPSPGGGRMRNGNQAAKTASGGISQFVSRITVNSDGLPVHSSSGPEAAREEWAKRLLDMNAAVNSIVLSRELDAIRNVYGLSECDHIGAHWSTSYNCDPELAALLEEAFKSYWEGRYSDSGRAAFPLIEAAIRGLLLALGEPLFRIENPAGDGKFPSLEIYCTRLERLGFDVDWLDLVRGPVAYLRNAMAHGHRLRLEAPEAALLLRVAALFVLLTPESGSVISRESVSRSLRDPIRATAGASQLRLRVGLKWVVKRRREMRGGETDSK
jgi:hypothetical protein